MRISDWSSDVCSSDLLNSRSVSSDAEAGTAMPSATDASARPTGFFMRLLLFRAVRGSAVPIGISVDGGGPPRLVAEEDRAGEIDAGLGDRLGIFIGLAQLLDGHFDRRLVGLPGRAIGIVLAGPADLDMATHHMRHRMRVAEVDQPLHAVEPRLPEADVAATTIEIGRAHV